MKNTHENWLIDAFYKEVRHIEWQESDREIPQSQIQEAIKIAMDVFSKVMRSPSTNSKGFVPVDANFANGTATSTSVTCPVCQRNFTIVKPKKADPQPTFVSSP